MGGFAPPLPGPGQPQTAPTPGAGAPPPGISGLVGGVPNATPVGPTPEQKIQAYMEQVRNIVTQIDALANQHPEVANDMNNAKNGLIESMSKVAAAMSSPESQPQPPTF